MKCLETRRTPEGFKRRRYVTPEGVRFSTIEVPLPVWNAINKQGHAHDRAKQWARARARDALRMRAIEHLRQGWKAIASAHELGVPVRTVERWRKNAKQELS